jgi:two-component system response regulator FixJ
VHRLGPDPLPPHPSQLIHISDPNLRTCEVLSAVFRIEGFETTFSVDTEALFTGLSRRKADAVVLRGDIAQPNGLDVMRRLRAEPFGLLVVMTLHPSDAELAVDAMKSGADDVLIKPIDADRIVRAVRGLLGSPLTTIRRKFGRGIPSEIPAFDSLTKREREVLNLVTNGQTNKDAAGVLGISPRTVEVHRANILSKLGATNTADLIRIVLTS